MMRSTLPRFTPVCLNHLALRGCCCQTMNRSPSGTVAEKGLQTVMPGNVVIERRSFRFALRFLLTVTTCTVIYLAGHRIGFESGYRKASNEYGDDAHGTYDVSDLVLPVTE